MPRSTPHLIALLVAAAVLPAPRALRAQAGGAKPDTAAHAQPDTARLVMHIRVIGVYDDETGEPIQDADITDMITGFTVRTTKTGTAPIYYTDGPGTLVIIKKLGYQRSLIAVATLPADSIPVTTTLLRAGHVLAPVIVVGDRVIKLGAGDTISTLLRNGFYERRETSAAPRAAFITGDKLQGTLLASDARYFGRGICESNVYVDGMPFTLPRRTGRFLKEGIDAYIDPFDIAGIETYTSGELPTGAEHTGEGDGALAPEAASAANSMASASGLLAGSGCVTMIWLRH